MPYFDYNATTPLAPAAREAWLRAVEEAWQNPSSPYRAGARVRNLLENARSNLADRLGARPDQVVFNSGATEGVNAVFSYCATRPDLKDLPVLVSPAEHPCVLAAAHRYFAGKIRFCPTDPPGRVETKALQNLLSEERFALVAVMAANNETGTLQPWPEIGEICRRTATLVHCDASQWVGKLPLDGLGASGFVTASAHKFGGPKGCGFLVTPRSVAGFHGQVGGEQENGLRAGTEDYPSIAAMVAALEEAEDRTVDPTMISQRLEWRQRFEREVERRVPGAKIAGHHADRLWNTVSLIFPIGANDRWVRKLDQAGFQVSTGSACSTGKESPSHVLAALGFSADEAKRAIRVSSGWETTADDWTALGEALETIFKELGNDGGNGERLTEVVRI